MLRDTLQAEQSAAMPSSTKVEKLVDSQRLTEGGL